MMSVDWSSALHDLLRWDKIPECIETHFAANLRSGADLASRMFPGRMRRFAESEPIRDPRAAMYTVAKWVVTDVHRMLAIRDRHNRRLGHEEWLLRDAGEAIPRARARRALEVLLQFSWTGITDGPKIYWDNLLNEIRKGLDDPDHLDALAELAKSNVANNRMASYLAGVRYGEGVTSADRARTKKNLQRAVSVVRGRSRLETWI